MRGSLALISRKMLHARSIPARAGEPVRPLAISPPIEVHPRACGGAYGAAVVASLVVGPSPRVRGSLSVRRVHHEGMGSIPARAGEPWASPVRDDLRGSIPARAGEPSPSSSQSMTAWVHPRACGGARPRRRVVVAEPGPSPRVRGSQRLHLRTRPRQRSIPARAGEPPTAGCGAACKAVHPRACGGARTGTARTASMTGPSPRVRGSRAPRRHRYVSAGSIPARAGEPGSAVPELSLHRVHPRACGGASPPKARSTS